MSQPAYRYETARVQLADGSEGAVTFREVSTEGGALSFTTRDGWVSWSPTAWVSADAQIGGTQP